MSAVLEVGLGLSGRASGVFELLQRVPPEEVAAVVVGPVHHRGDAIRRPLPRWSSAERVGFEPTCSPLHLPTRKGCRSINGEFPSAMSRGVDTSVGRASRLQREGRGYDLPIFVGQIMT
jgi:hypothetical protein